MFLVCCCIFRDIIFNELIIYLKFIVFNMNKIIEVVIESNFD